VEGSGVILGVGSRILLRKRIMHVEKQALMGLVE
jgi:hypothetical protein